MKSMLCGLRPASSVVRLLVPLSIGFEARCRPMFSLPVTMRESAAPLRFGGLKTSMRLSVLLCWCVVLTQTLSRLWIGVRLRQLLSCPGWTFVLMRLLLSLVLGVMS